ncbi:hypothetical protein NST32_05250 [Bacillus sp. FSL L8-0215]|uniref:hypothetical protein n=1 Tax=Bacillus sp. FSL L8-0215 TaxID=2954617 RepID=UPI003158FE94
MKTVKSIIFLVGVCLANVVAGIPYDSKNLFITHTIFLAPYLVDYYPLLKLEKPGVRWLIRIIWVAGILMLISNILGVTGVLTVVDFNVVFGQGVISIVKFKIPLDIYILISVAVYLSVFGAPLIIKTYHSEYEKHTLEKKMKKKKQQSNTNGVVLERG